MPMKLSNKHIENLQALVENPNGLRCNQFPHPRLVKNLKSWGLVDARGDTWIALHEINQEGLNALERVQNGEDIPAKGV